MNRSRVCLSPNMEDRRQAGLAGKRCSRLASQQQRQDVAFEPLRPTSSGWLEARLNLESATCLYGRFGIDGLRTHTHSRVAGVVHEPTVGVVPAAGQHRAIPSWPQPMTTVSLSGPRVLAVIATSLVGGVVCGSLIRWFLRVIKCSGRAWLLGSSSMMLRSRPAAIANRAAVGWLRRAGSDSLPRRLRLCGPTGADPHSQPA
jgi:hypothetical protein